MNQNENKLLVISPCTKRMGVAVFNRFELVYFAVITLKPPRQVDNIESQVSERIRAIIKEFAPKLVIVKTLNKYQIKSDKLHSVVKSVEQEAGAGDLPIQKISFETVKREFCPVRKPTKANAFRFLSESYPELKQFVNHPSKWQVDYYNSLLSAAAIGFYCRNKAEREHGSQY